jgi:hypothetical protein
VVQVLASDLFGTAGTAVLDRLDLPAPYAARVASLRRVIDLLEFDIGIFAGPTRTQLAADPGYTAVQQIPRIGPILGAVFVAEIGDIGRSAPLGPAVATVAGVISDRDLPPGRGGELGVQVRLVPLHRQHVVRAAATDEVLRVCPLDVQGVGGDDGTGDVDAVEKRREHGDSFVLAATSTAPGRRRGRGRGQPAGAERGPPATPDPRTVLPSTATLLRPVGGGLPEPP